jgi:hypothetical protein
MRFGPMCGSAAVLRHSTSGRGEEGGDVGEVAIANTARSGPRNDARSSMAGGSPASATWVEALESSRALCNAGCSRPSHSVMSSMAASGSTDLRGSCISAA